MSNSDSDSDYEMSYTAEAPKWLAEMIQDGTIPDVEQVLVADQEYTITSMDATGEIIAQEVGHDLLIAFTHAPLDGLNPSRSPFTLDFIMGRALAGSIMQRFSREDVIELAAQVLRSMDTGTPVSAEVMHHAIDVEARERDDSPEAREYEQEQYTAWTEQQVSRWAEPEPDGTDWDDLDGDAGDRGGYD